MDKNVCKLREQKYYVALSKKRACQSIKTEIKMNIVLKKVKTCIFITKILLIFEWVYNQSIELIVCGENTFQIYLPHNGNTLVRWIHYCL